MRPDSLLVLVCVKSRACEPAVRVAAEEARLRSCGVHLVHVGGESMTAGPIVPAEISWAALRQANALLDDVAAGVEDLLPPTLRVTTEVCRGRVLPSLLRSASRACLLIVQQPDRDLDGPSVHSVSAGLAARSAVDTMLVPARWCAPPLPDGMAVSVGVAEAGSDAAVVRTALAEAWRRGSRLRIVHGWWSLPTHSSWSLTDETATAHSVATAARLSSLFADVLAEHPDVPVDYVVDCDFAADSLLDHLDGSSLLVVGRHRGTASLPASFGPVAREVAAASVCPVLVVDQGPSVTTGWLDGGLSAAAVP